MLSLNASVSVTRKTAIARLKGELDEASIKEFKLKLSNIINDFNVCNIIFNLENISFMDSSAIGLIMGRYKQVIKNNGKVILCGLNDQLHNIIQLSGLLKICQTTTTEEAAKNLLGVI